MKIIGLTSSTGKAVRHCVTCGIIPSFDDTGIKVSVAGLDCGGPNLIGLKQEQSGKLSIRLVRNLGLSRAHISD